MSNKCSYCGNESELRDTRGGCIACGGNRPPDTSHTKNQDVSYVSWISGLVATNALSIKEAAYLLLVGFEEGVITTGGGNKYE